MAFLKAKMLITIFKENEKFLKKCPLKVFSLSKAKNRGLSIVVITYFKKKALSDYFCELYPVMPSVEMVDIKPLRCG